MTRHQRFGSIVLLISTILRSEATGMTEWRRKNRGGLRMTGLGLFAGWLILGVVGIPLAAGVLGAVGAGLILASVPPQGI